MAASGSIHFEISERKILLRIIDVVVVLAALHLVGITFEFDYFTINEEHWLWSILLGFYLLFFATVFELYNLHRASRIAPTLKAVIITASVTSLIYLLTPFFTPSLPENRLQILFFYLAITVSLLLWRALYIKFFSSARFNKDVLLVAGSEQVSGVAATLIAADPNFNIAGFIAMHGGAIDQQVPGYKNWNLNNVKDIIDKTRVNEIVVVTNDQEPLTAQVYNWLIETLENGLIVREYSQVYEEITDRIPVQYVGKEFYKHFPFARNNQNKLYLVYHRAFDILLSIVGLLSCLFVLPLILIGNLIANKGSLFYTQTRVGKNRKEFSIIKFRTMVKNAEASGAQFAKLNDTRITKFGSFLRRSRLDELPQFYNILKGEMSVIGPRPERPVFVKQLAEKIPFYETRHIIKPGLTGWAQVKTRYGVSEEDHLLKLQYDLYYIKRRSLFLDLRIIVKTISTVVFFKGQ